jgi:pimeloyl-ACP methyl ester carboxylesterase
MRIERNGVGIHVSEHGPADGPLIVMLHGFPELGWSWRHQIPALAEAGYHLYVPDLRGFGLSDSPEAVEDLDVIEHAADVLALIDHAGRDTAVVIGHDWGADVAWKTAWMHPDRVSAVCGISVPYVRRAHAAPLGLLREGLGDDFYIVWFQEVGPAEEALSKDVRRTMSTKRQWDPAWAANENENPPTPAFMTDDELQVYVDAYERTGFRGGLAMYRNIDRNWERTAPFDDRTIDQPALFITGERDPVRKFMPEEAMDGQVTDLRATVVVPGAGHWVNQEKPDEVNDALLSWLREVA